MESNVSSNGYSPMAPLDSSNSTSGGFVDRGSQDADGHSFATVDATRSMYIYDGRKNVKEILNSSTEFDLSDSFIEKESKPLGEGAYGAVYKGKVQTRDGREIIVAIKTAKNKNNEHQVDAVVQEFNLLASRIGCHEHIVRLIGLRPNGGPHCDEHQLLLEFCEHGSLKGMIEKHADCLRRGRSTDGCGITVNLLLQLALQTAKGLEYLRRQKVIHRDVAARNVLVARAPPPFGYCAKLADFGISRIVYSYYRAETERDLPIYWMAYESLITLTFHFESDVWSFGVLLAEILSFCEEPLRAYKKELTSPSKNRRLQIAESLRKGFRIPQPELASGELYRLMCRCWKIERSLRPRITDVREELERLVNRRRRFDGFLCCF